MNEVDVYSRECPACEAGPGELCRRGDRSEMPPHRPHEARFIIAGIDEVTDADREEARASFYEWRRHGRG